MKTLNRILIILLSIVALALVRHYQSNIFYDPFIDYFKNINIGTVIPRYDIFKLIGSYSLRFIINILFSCLIVYCIFNSKAFALSMAMISTFLFFVLIFLFVIFLREQIEESYLYTFYIRRFIIHPLLLLIFIPAFYIIKRKENV